MLEQRLVVPALTLGSCSQQELPALLAALDREFVSSRGRRGSLAERYPGLFDAENLHSLQVLRDHDGPVACCVVKPFDWHSAGERWQAAMIGMVYTDPTRRGQGHAATVLNAALDQLAAAGVDFAVLWSALDGYYERLGWLPHDRGIFGSASLPRTRQITPICPIDRAAIEAIRLRHSPARVARSGLAYSAVPLPAERVGVSHVQIGEAEAYALVGYLGATRYVYEALGEEAALPALWRQLSSGATTVHVNESLGSPFHRWLTRHTALAFSDQQLAYWRPISPRAERAPWRQWHIPYFDRI